MKSSHIAEISQTQINEKSVDYNSQSPISSISHLQNTIGNRVLARLVQRKSGKKNNATNKNFEDNNRKLESASIDSSVAQLKSNQSPLPDQLKTSMENLSGISMDDATVSYNSKKPAKIDALAYAQGSEIHLAPGQEKHLPHEVWHVVQQKQGRVKPTLQMKDGLNINYDTDLEKEADTMGVKAMSGVSQTVNASLKNCTLNEEDLVIQGCWNKKFLDDVLFKGEVEYEDDVDFSEISSLDFAEKSLSKGREIAYIVNAILPFSEIGKIPEVVGAILDGLAEEDYDRVAIILGINGKEDDEETLDEALEEASDIISELP